jgi:hydrogenase maturation protease
MRMDACSSAWHVTEIEMGASLLIFGYGNPSRGDDALGPAFIERIEALQPAHPEWTKVDLLTDFQIQVEHALDIRGRELVILVDASITADAPFSYERLSSGGDPAYTTHIMLPQTLLTVYETVTGEPPPPVYLLGIRGEDFELGKPLSAAASANLESAIVFMVDLLSNRSSTG